MPSQSSRLPVASAAESATANFVSRNIRLDGRRTSIRLERVMWEAFDEIAEREGKSTLELCDLIAAHKIGANMTAAVRLFIVVYYRLALYEREKQGPALRVVAGTEAPTAASTSVNSEIMASGYSALMKSALGK
jgi:predicted DNA-binding ribbon-helix-helix protein